MAGLAGGDHGVGRAAGPLRVRRLRVDPEPERDADRVRGRAEQGDGAVDAAAHRYGRAPGTGGGLEHLADRAGERVGGERLPGTAADSSSVSPGERLLEPGRVRVDDPVAVDPKPDERNLAIPRRIPDNLDHRPPA